MFKRSLMAAVILSAAIVAAHAGDFPTKAPQASNPYNAYALTAPTPAVCTTTGCTGWYGGFEMSGDGITGINVLNLAGQFAGGTYMGSNIGYQYFAGGWLLGAKVKLDYEVYSTAPAGGAFSNKLFAFEGAELGGNASAIFTNAPAPIQLSGPLANATPTILIGACQHGSQTGYCVGAGAHFYIPNSAWTIDVDYLNAQYSPAAGVTGGTVDNRGSFGFSYHFSGL